MAFEEVRSSFDKFCLIAGIEALQELLQEEAAALCGERHQRHAGRRGRRWGETRSPVAFHGGRVGVDRPRVRSREGEQELVLPSWAAAQDEDWLGQWAMNQMLINVSTRKFRRSVRLPGGDVGSLAGDGTSKSAVSRKFVALSSAKLRQWLASDLSPLDLLAIQIDGLHISDELILVAAVGIDGRGEKHPLGLVRRGDRERRHGPGPARQPGRARPRPGGGLAVHHRWRQGTVQSDPPDVWPGHADPALSGAQGAHHHRAVAQIAARRGAQGPAAGLGAGRCRQGRAAGPQPGAAAGEGLARHLGHPPGGAGRNPVAWFGSACPRTCGALWPCTNIIENMNGTIRQVTRNVKRWRDASMALRWTAAGMREAKKGFRRLKAYKQLPKLKDALLALKAARAAALADHFGLANLGEAA